MDAITHKMPCDKAPGPNVFNVLFLEKWRPVIKDCFYKLAEDFYLDKVPLDSINTSYITMVPKC
jgi:hypothetical protein